VQLIGLEGEDPLVVAERERRDRVGAHVRVAPGHPAVLGQQVTALLVGQQVPLVRAHERVDADVVAGRLTGQERRQVALVELGRPVQRHHRPHRRQVASQHRAPEHPIRLLQRLGARRVPPHHEVGVGPQRGHVIRPAHHHVLARQLLEQAVDLGHDLVARRRAELVGDPEHRPHRVSDRGVQLPQAGRVRLGLGHAINPRIT
jgi:hypothetical protein